MSVEDIVMSFVIGPVFVAVGWAVMPRLWRGKIDAYEHNWVVHIFVGESGRAGINAMVPVTIVALTAAWLAFLVDALSGHWRIATTLWLLFLAGLLSAFSLLFFMFPRVLAPPWVRHRRGWIPEAWHRLRMRWRDRRGSDGAARG